MDNSKKGNTMLLTVIAVATLLVAIVGATFAYFTATVQGNDTASSVIVNTAALGTVTYKNGNELNIPNALPGAQASVKFTIAQSASANVDVDYTISWVNVTNTFTNKAELIYSLEGTKDKTGTLVSVAADSNTPAPSSAGPITGTGTLKPGETHTYTLTVRFRETGSDQNSNQGKSFVGKIEVATGEGSYYNADNPSGTDTAPGADTGITE